VFHLLIAFVARPRRWRSRNSLVVGLNDRDLIQKPKCSTALGNVLYAIGVENVPVDSVPIPVFAAGGLREVAFAESLRRHDVPLSF
jgi:hypothetical protein